MVIKKRDFWDNSAKNYDKNSKILYKLYKKTIDITIPNLKKSYNILDIGAGTGIITTEISKHVKSITAIDISENMLKELKNKIKLKNIKNIKTETYNGKNFKYKENKFDVILLYNVLPYIKNQNLFIKKIHKILKEEGLLLIVTDCNKEKSKTLIEFMRKITLKIMNKIKVIDFIQFQTKEEIKKIINKTNFKILEEKMLSNSPPNYFIKLKK